MIKPNHICKYSKCNLGKDENGNPCQKHYYACDYCDRTANWKSMCCCFEHYQLYIQEVLEVREYDRKLSMLPHRTDMTEEEVKQLMTEPIDLVKEKTEKELSQYKENDEALNVEKVVEKINDEIDKKTFAHSVNRSNRKKRAKK